MALYKYLYCSPIISQHCTTSTTPMGKVNQFQRSNSSLLAHTFISYFNKHHPHFRPYSKPNLQNSCFFEKKTWNNSPVELLIWCKLYSWYRLWVRPRPVKETHWVSTGRFFSLVFSEWNSRILKVKTNYWNLFIQYISLII